MKTIHTVGAFVLGFVVTVFTLVVCMQLPIFQPFLGLTGLPITTAEANAMTETIKNFMVPGSVWESVDEKTAHKIIRSCVNVGGGGGPDGTVENYALFYGSMTLVSVQSDIRKGEIKYWVRIQ